MCQEIKARTAVTLLAALPTRFTSRTVLGSASWTLPTLVTRRFTTTSRRRWPWRNDVRVLIGALAERNVWSHFMFSSRLLGGVLGAVIMLVAPARVEAQEMYWVSGYIYRANLDGSNVERVRVNNRSTIGIALDLPAAKIYWATWSASRIMRAGLDGSDVEIVIDTRPMHPQGIALHRATGKLYCTASETGLGGGIFSSNLDGQPRGA